MRHQWFLVLPAAALLILSIWTSLPSGRLEFRLQSSGLTPEELEIVLCLDSKDTSESHCFSLLYVREQTEDTPGSENEGGV